MKDRITVAVDYPRVLPGYRIEMDMSFDELLKRLEEGQVWFKVFVDGKHAPTAMNFAMVNRAYEVAP